jgi:hypothetical protein
VLPALQQPALEVPEHYQKVKEREHPKAGGGRRNNAKQEVDKQKH